MMKVCPRISDILFPRIRDNTSLGPPGVNATTRVTGLFGYEDCAVAAEIAVVAAIITPAKADKIFRIFTSRPGSRRPGVLIIGRPIPTHLQKFGSIRFCFLENGRMDLAG